jgi:beta-phosphoglucomutase-like phosphatase (HAD superfamily)
MRQPAIIFDLDGTLVDSVYEHVMTWAEVLRTQGIVNPPGDRHEREALFTKTAKR